MVAEFASELVSGFLHELVTVSAAFEDARFKAAGGRPKGPVISLVSV
jgi:hypothetical protein